MRRASPKSLGEIAEDAGFSIADVAFLAHLEESTVSRLWADLFWLDKIKGASLQALIGVLPGVADCLMAHALGTRRAALARDLETEGLAIDNHTIECQVAARGVPEQYIGTALETAVHLMRGDPDAAAKYLVRFWGRDQDFVLGMLFDARPGSGLLCDPAPLVAASEGLLDRLSERSRSFHAFIAHATLVHHIAKSTGRMTGELPAPEDRQSAFTYRSGTIGMIIQSSDFDSVERYARLLRKTPLLRLVEDWSFPTYTRDARHSLDFSLPRSLSLSHTAVEVIREIRDYNEAYLRYLVSVYIPIALARDPTFGGRRRGITRALLDRLESCEDQATLKEIDELAKKTA